MRRALVTGGSRGIGAAIVSAFNDLGYRTFTFSRNGPLRADATLEDNRKKIKEYVGHCDILVNNVGGGGRFGDNHEVWAKNIDAMTDFTAWALNGMLQRNWGRVITISSIHGKEYGSRPIFMAAKAAQIAYMKGKARDKDYARRGITFNTVCPGNVLVEGKPRVDEEALPMGRMGTPQEVAALVVFLCSDQAAWINGSSITIDGGESISL